MRIPRKKELLELQKKYHSDKKIGEVYGVPARLVAYWRSKKKIGPYSYPKYNEDKILECWERFGDDSKAGAELGISAAGFRQWRRRYEIIGKPQQLRLEQLELALNDNGRKKSSKKETVIRKILARKSGLKNVDVEQIVNVEPDLVMTRNNAAEVIEQFNKIGAGKIWDPDKLVIVLDQNNHHESNNDIDTIKSIREFARIQKLKHFYDIGEGICHQVVVENGHVLPGQLAFGVDPFAISYGCLGAVSVGITETEMAAVWATGRMWLKIPPTDKIEISGKLGRGVFPGDIMLKIIHDLAKNKDEFRSLEFCGPAVSAMSVSERFTLTGLAALTGAKSAVTPFDDSVSRYLRKIAKVKYSPVRSDPDAEYNDEIEIDINYLTPQISFAGRKEGLSPIEEVAGRKVDLVVLGSYANGHIDDLEIAAKILRGRRINRDLRMIIVPGSRKILLEAIDRGYVKIFVESGCMVVNPGYKIGLDNHNRMLEKGERALTTAIGFSNGLAESTETELMMASPATAAATALEGSVADPRKYIR